ncbi:hypothetical protein [Gimesia sp.]|uniref:hypothetical protein n=1 Tax=Gimesia sp. TaxID=2024833 RepID=UPI003A8E2B77
MQRSSRKWVLSMTGVFFILFCLILSYSLMDSPTQKSLKNVKRDFADFTGLEWPEGATVISIGETRDPGSFRGGGAYHLIFHTDPETVQKWLTGDPPWKGDEPQWNIAEWTAGPVADEIEYNFNNFSRACWVNPEFPVAILPVDKKKLIESAESANLLRLDSEASISDYPYHREHNNMAELQSPYIRYVVKLGSIEAEGKLFAIDTKNNIVFVSLWDIVR